MFVYLLVLLKKYFETFYIPVCSCLYLLSVLDNCVDQENNTEQLGHEIDWVTILPFDWLIMLSLEYSTLTILKKVI